MKIDIGSEGKILGTKRVSPNGQVSGLSEYAGEEVLIVYPGPREPRIRMDTKDYMREMEAVVQVQMRKAFGQYRVLKAKYQDEAGATREFLREKTPKGFQGLVETVDDWVRGQVQKAEKAAGRRRGDAAPPSGSDAAGHGGNGSNGDHRADGSDGASEVGRAQAD